ncbi:hypothetical protein PR002_g5234 [Phytophthora rubi]|uniref:Reverse transcriptase Ty1/copia-type domain-containing protein n=1 Tax=Phytophthora rubi TaxID=129364 RepID=A0A6A3N348_9STRA|nr:hypothetical protein PR002_g5234 [Phytophthora rubi]
MRAAIYYAIQHGWLVLQYDVKTAFLYGDLDDSIFMEQPPGFQIDGSSMVCRLLKSLYGLKQAPNIWNKTLPREAKDREVTLLLTIYVDDLLLMGRRKLCEEVAASLQETFEITMMGAVKYLLGVEILINKTRKQIVYSQRQYVLEVLKRFHMETFNGSATPEATTPSSVEVPATKEYLPYRELCAA